jgi:hypothetical protein
MSLIAQSPWTDAANYGAGLGESLSQGLLQLPMERQRLAQQRLATTLQNLLAQQRLQDLTQYRLNQLGLGQEKLGVQGNQNDVMDTLKRIALGIQQQNANSKQTMADFPREVVFQIQLLHQ